MDRWIVDISSHNERLLSFARKKLKDSFSIKDLRWAIEHHRCRVNGVIERFCSRRLKSGDNVTLEAQARPLFTFAPERVLFDSEEWIAYDKPAGIPSDELAAKLRLFLVHRLDRDTTGLLLLTKTAPMQQKFEALFRSRSIQKSYLALVNGRLREPRGTIENYIGKVSEREGEGVWAVVPAPRGRYAKTEWECERVFKKFSLVRCHPITGRTHQIRIHLSGLGFPIVGDLRYGSRVDQERWHRPLLHAEQVTFPDPSTQKPICIHSPLPQDFLEGLEGLL